MMRQFLDNDIHRKQKRKYRSIKRASAVLLMLIMTAGVLGGCGGGRPAASTDETGVSSVDETGAENDVRSGETGTGEENSDNEPAAMGRYVETTVDVLENTSRSYNITVLTDGRLVILDETAGQLISADGGINWEVVSIPGIDNMKVFTENNYIFSMAAASGRDGGGALFGQCSVRSDGRI